MTMTVAGSRGNLVDVLVREVQAIHCLSVYSSTAQEGPDKGEEQSE